MEKQTTNLFGDELSSVSEDKIPSSFEGNSDADKTNFFGSARESKEEKTNFFGSSRELKEADTKFESKQFEKTNFFGD